jgi:hypothetical protein
MGPLFVDSFEQVLHFKIELAEFLLLAYKALNPHFFEWLDSVIS